MLLNKLTKIRSKNCISFGRRVYSSARDTCEAPPSYPRILDEICPTDNSCQLRDDYQQHWIECRKPCIITRSLEVVKIPFVKRKTRPSTASKCAILGECVRPSKLKHCKYSEQPEYVRNPNPCPSFSETLDYRPVRKLSECDCVRIGPAPIKFGYEVPCYDPYKYRKN